MGDNAIKRLLRIIENQLGWGPAENWPSKDFEKLNVLIQEKTKISLSSSTLRRLWGKADYKNQPSLTTLDTLAQFAGYEDWRKFKLVGQDLKTASPKIERPIKIVLSKKRRIYGLVVVIMVPLIIVIFVYRIVRATVNDTFRFEYHSVTRDLPNSVVFTYDVGAHSSDSVIIQQSWDRKLRSNVSATQHKFVSTYYRPGFFLAKLLVAGKIVKERPLLIPTKGWLAMIDQDPVPFYLEKEDFLQASFISVSAETLKKNNISLNPKTPTVEIYNVGNFSPTPLSDFNFNAEVKDDYEKGSSKCQLISIRLITDASPIDIPLSAPGCIGELSFSDGNKDISGKTTDLSGFGINESAWIKVNCHTERDSILFSVNNQLIYKSSKSKKNTKILGIGFSFQGTAMVRHVLLKSKDKTVFNDLKSP